MRILVMEKQRHYEFRVSMDKLSSIKFHLETTIYHINLPQRGYTPITYIYQRENR